MKSVGALILAAASVNADVYLHNPRGSNNRLDEANRDRNNGNRLWDSQNNNRGGNNVGQVYYYANTEVPIEWTNQHTCGNANNNCEIIIQYMCDSRLRDGTTTNTIPTNSLQCYGWDCDQDVRFGRHESWDYYMNCANRERNKGLFTSDQKLNGNQAIYTRQNPNGGRRGLECPEERDYYPYWGPTPWRDIAILTNQPERCAAYQAESQNVKPRKFCDLPYTARQYNSNKPIPITQAACEEVNYFDQMLNTTVRGSWKTREAFNVEAPLCLDSPWTRDNHLGNDAGGETAVYRWKVPSDWIHDRCALRIRYNISTDDIDHFDSASAITSANLNATYNGEGNSQKNNGDTLPILAKEIGEKYGLTEQEAKDRQYWLEGNPDVQPFGPSQLTTPIELQLAINTNQFGRTFEDRTFRFSIKSRPSDLQDAVIQNVQVRGKRGNIVQTYPGTEYDFTPNQLNCKKDDYVHFQWTGSNTNPNNNAGQGKQGTDRHNVLRLKAANFAEVGQSDNKDYGNVYGQFGNSYPAHLDDAFLGFSRTDKEALAILNGPGRQFGGEMSELDDAGTYFDLGPRRCTQNGVYHYMSTRNNNFSNRSQKAKITVSNIAQQLLTVGINGGSLSLDGSSVVIGAGTFSMAQTIVIATYPMDHPASFEEQEGGVASLFFRVSVENSETNNFALSPGKTVGLNVAYETSAVGYAEMWRSESFDGTWTEVEEVTFEEDQGKTEITNGGIFVVKTQANVVAIVFITLAVIGTIAGLGYLGMKRYRSSAMSGTAMRGF
jgi:hypothetical protein